MLSGKVAIHDIEDAEAFVIGCMRRSRVQVHGPEREDLIAEGLAILWELGERFEPRREGYAQDGKFSGYAAMYLPRRMGEAYHRMHPEAVLKVDKESGTRRYEYLPKPDSWNQMCERNPSVSDTDRLRGVGEFVSSDA